MSEKENKHPELKRLGIDFDPLALFCFSLLKAKGFEPVALIAKCKADNQEALFTAFGNDHTAGTTIDLLMSYRPIIHTHKHLSEKEIIRRAKTGGTDGHN